MSKPLDIVIFGLSITSSWGNGHATTYRALVRALSARGHNVCFLERDMPWYAEHRDMPNPPFGLTQLYKSVAELKRKFESKVKNADLCIVGSYVPDGIAIGEWVTRTCRGVKAFYDIDTPCDARQTLFGRRGIHHGLAGPSLRHLSFIRGWSPSPKDRKRFRIIHGSTVVLFGRSKGLLP